MKRTEMTFAELALISATRGMAGAGLALLLSQKLSPEKRKMVGWPLIVIGGISTIPILIDVLKRSR